MEIHWNNLKGLRTGADRAARTLAAAALLVMAAGPLPATPSTSVEAKDLEWADTRLILTNDADTTEGDGFQRLADFGTVLHAMAVGPNGDLFAGGTGADVIVGVAAVNADQNADGLPDAAAAVRPAVFRSTDGGNKWRAVPLPAGIGNGATIFDIVVSPDYPSDGFVGVVVGGGAAASNMNAFCWSTNQGLAFTCRRGDVAADQAAGFDDILWRTAALSPNFNFNDKNGVIALGGMWVATVTTMTVPSTDLAAGNLTAIPEAAVPVGGGNVADNAADGTLSLAYTYSEEPSTLARLVVDGNGVRTFAQTRGTSWPAADAATELLDGNAAAFAATTGQVAFDDVYTAGGSFFAAAGNGAAVGGVFKFDGTWLEKTGAANADCNASMDSLAVSGNGSSTKLVASRSASNKVCRSTNEGGSWSDNEADGGDAFCDQCTIDPAGAMTRVAGNRTTGATVYWSTSGARGGIQKSTNTGSSFSGTGLSNLAYSQAGPLETSTTQSFMLGAAGGSQGMFMTNNHGTGAAWNQVLRYTGTDLKMPAAFPSDFGTAGTAYVYRDQATTDVVLKSSDGGRTWDKTSSDPFANGPETTELIRTITERSASTVVVGGDKGHVSITEDGGATWTVLAKDFGGRIDEFDFIGSGITTFIATALGDDSVMRLWLTTDGGANFAEIGNAAGAWGTGDTASFTTLAGSFDGTKGILLAVTNGASTDDVWRYDAAATSPTWVDGGTDAKWATATLISAPGIGDGRLLHLWNPGTPAFFRTYFPFSTTSADWNEQRLATQLPPVVGGALGTARGSEGYTVQITSAGRNQELTFTKAFLDGVSMTSPLDGGNVATNVGDNGIPAIFRWNSVGKAACYDVQIALEPTFDSPALDPTGVAGACPATNGVSTGSSIQITQAIFALVQGQTYYTRVRVRSTDASLAGIPANVSTMPGPWAKGTAFSVSTTSTQVIVAQPSLPLNGSQLPGVGTSLSWNNPAGVTQVHIQVTPLNNDGPAINLILGSPATSYDVPAPVAGTGPYVMLPGATYTWRLRVSNSTSAIGETDASWGPWSEPRTFTTALPNSGTIQLVGPINGAAITDTTPALSWKDGNAAMFYYEIQVSADKNFGEAGPVAAVLHNLVHGFVATPENTWTVPDAAALAKGTYYWRIRQRVQATPKGAVETGIAWSPAQSFVVN